MLRSHFNHFEERDLNRFKRAFCVHAVVPRLRPTKIHYHTTGVDPGFWNRGTGRAPKARVSRRRRLGGAGAGSGEGGRSGSKWCILVLILTRIASS